MHSNGRYGSRIPHNYKGNKIIYIKQLQHTFDKVMGPMLRQLHQFEIIILMLTDNILPMNFSANS